MAFPAPDWDGVIREVDRSFVETLRANLSAAGLFTVKQVRDLGIQTVQWKELSDIPGAKISMHIPELAPDSGTITAKSVDLPVLTKDSHYDFRQYLAAQASGVDTAASDELAFALAVEVNKLLLKGNTGGPGPATGLLNHADILTVTATAGNFTVGSDVVKYLNEAIAKLQDKKHYGPYVLLHAPLDGDIFGGFITNTSVQVREKIPSLVSKVIPEHEVAQNEMFLVEVSPRNFDAVSPFPAIGQTELWSYQNPITKGLDLRWITAVAPRIKRATAVCKITFDRS